MSEALGKRKRGGKRDRALPKVSIRQEPSEEPEPEDHITKEEYEKKKSDILRRAVLAEAQYVKLRSQLRENRIREVREFREKISLRKCPEYLKGKRAAEKKLARKNDINQATYELKMAQILDEFEAESSMNETQHEDKYYYAKSRFIDFFTDLIAEKKKREREVGIIMGVLLTLPPIGNPVTEKPVFKDVVYSGRQTRSRSKSLKDDMTKNQQSTSAI